MTKARANKKMKRSEMLDNLKTYAAEHSDEIIEKIIEAKKDAEGYMQGMHIAVLVDIEDSEVYYSGAMSQGSVTQGQFDGKALTIAILDCWQVGWDGYDYNFDENVKNIEEYEALQNEYDENEENYYSFYDFVKEEHPEIIEKLDAEYKEYLIDEWFPEMANEKYDGFIENLELDIENTISVEGEIDY